jgi:hypothetical protein
MRILASFVGKNRDFKKWIAAQKKQQTAQVIYLQHCELCGRLSKSPFCRRCELRYLLLQTVTCK